MYKGLKMKKLVLAVMLLVGTASLNALAPALAPWLDQHNKAFQLPSKDKDKLQIISNTVANPAKAVTGGTKGLSQAVNTLAYNTAVKDLSSQIDRVKLSMSGIMSSLSWRERLQALKESLSFIQPTNDAIRGLLTEIEQKLN